MEGTFFKGIVKSAGVYRREALEAKRIARERIEKLFTLAEKTALGGDRERSRKYVLLARRLGMKLDIPVGHRKQFCRECSSYLLPGRNCRVRISGKRLAITCLECGKISRFPLSRRQKSHRVNACNSVNRQVIVRQI
jgi:ribonuclease P protein subunit RPR2